MDASQQSAYEKQMMEESQKQYIWSHLDKFKNKNKPFSRKSLLLKPAIVVNYYVVSDENKNSQTRKSSWHWKFIN